MNIKNDAVNLSELGYSKAQINVLVRMAKERSTTIVISGFTTSIKSGQARILQSIRTEEKFRDKRRRRESRHQK